MELVEKTKRRVRIERGDDPLVVAQGFVEILREFGFDVECTHTSSEEARFAEFLIEKSSRRLM